MCDQPPELDDDAIALTINYLLPPYLLKKIQQPATPAVDFDTYKEQIKGIVDKLLSGCVEHENNGDDSIPQHLKKMFVDFVVECNYHFKQMERINMVPTTIDETLIDPHSERD